MFKRFRKVASLALATLMLASPLQVFAESGTGTGGNGGGGGSQSVPAGDWAISSNYKASGTKVSLAKGKYKTYTDSDYGKGYFMQYTPIGARPGYSLNASFTTGTTPVYFMGNDDQRVKKELVSVDGGSKGYQLESELRDYVVQDAGYYIAGTDIPVDVMRAVIDALKADYTGSVGDINDILRLPKTKEDADKQTESQKKWTKNVFRSLGTIMLKEYGSNINSNVKTALEGIAQNGVYVSQDGQESYEYFFVLEPYVTVNTGGEQFILTPNTLMQIYMKSANLDIRKGNVGDTSNNYRNFWNHIRRTPFWSKGTANMIVNYMTGKGTPMNNYTPNWEGRSSVAGLLWYQGPTPGNNAENERASKKDYRLGFGTLRPNDYVSGVRSAEVYYGIGDIAKPERSGGNLFTLSSDYVNGLQKIENDKITVGQVDSSLADGRNSMVSHIYATTINMKNPDVNNALQVANTVTSVKIQLPDAAHLKGTTSSVKDGAYISVGTGANAEQVRTSKNPEFGEYYLDKTGMVIHSGSVNVEFNSKALQVPAGTAYVVDKAMEEAAKDIQNRLTKESDPIVVSRTGKDLVYGEGQMGAFSYKVLNGVEVDKLVKSKVDSVQKSKETYTHPDNHVYQYDGTLVGPAPTLNNNIGAQGRAGRVVNQILAMTAQNKKELANTLIVQGANVVTGLERTAKEGKESRNGNAPLQYAMLYEGVPVIFQFIKKVGEDYQVVQLANGKDHIETNQKAAAIFESIITLPESVKDMGNIKRVVVKASSVPMETFLKNIKNDLDNYTPQTNANNFITPIVNINNIKQDGVPMISISARGEDITSGKPISIIMVIEDTLEQKLIKVYGDDKGKHDKTTITDITTPTVDIKDEGNYKVEEIFVSREKTPNLSVNTPWADVVQSKDGTDSFVGPTLIDMGKYGKEDNTYVYVQLQRPAESKPGQAGDKTSHYVSFQIPFNELKLNPIDVTASEGNYGYGKHIWSHLSLGEGQGCGCPGTHSCSGRYDGNTLFDGKCDCYGTHSCTEAGEDRANWCGHDESEHYIGDNCYCPGDHGCGGCYCPGDHVASCSSSCYSKVLNCSTSHSHTSSCYSEEKTCSGSHYEYCSGGDCECDYDHSCSGCECSGHSCSYVGYACKYETNTHSCTEWGESGCYCPSRHSCSEWGWEGCTCPGHGCVFKRIIDMNYDIEIKETEENDKKVIADGNIPEFKYDYYNNHKAGTIGYQQPSTYPKFKGLHHTAVAHRGYDVVTIAKYKENGSKASSSLGKLGYPTANNPKGKRSNGHYTKNAKWVYDVYGNDPYTHTQCYVPEAEKKGVVFEHDHEPKFVDDAPDLPFTLTFQQTLGVENVGAKPGTSYADPSIDIVDIIFKDQIDSVVYSNGNWVYHPYVKMLWETAPVNGNKEGTEDLPVMILADHTSTFRPNNTITIAMNNKGESLKLTSKQWSTHREATNGNIGWDKAGQVLPGGATFRVEESDKPLEIGVKFEMVYVPDEIARNAPEYNLQDYSYTKTEEKINGLLEDIERQLADAARLDMLVNVDWRSDFRDGVVVDSGKSVTLNRPITLSRDKKYWLHDTGSVINETSKQLGFEVHREKKNNYLIRSNTDGDVELLKNGAVVKKFAKTVTNAQILQQLPAEFEKVNKTTKFIENFLNTIDRNINPGPDQWYNEAWDGIGVRVHEAVYKLDLGDVGYRIAVVEPKLTPEQQHMGEAFSKAYGFGLASPVEDITINVDGQSLELTGFRDAIATQQVYLPNTTVMDINQ